MTTRWKLTVALAAIGVAFGACTVASIRQDELLRSMPTDEVQRSKKMGVFVGSLDVSPTSVNFGGTRFQIVEVWLEHLSKPQRVSLFYTRQEIFPELVLCVRVSPFLIQNEPKIKGAVTAHIGISGSGSNRGYVMFSEIVSDAPESFVLCSQDGSDGVSVTIKKRPNQPPEPTSTSVTSAAFAPAAPLVLAAHL